MYDFAWLWSYSVWLIMSKNGIWARFLAPNTDYGVIYIPYLVLLHQKCTEISCFVIEADLYTILFTFETFLRHFIWNVAFRASYGPENVFLGLGV